MVKTLDKINKRVDKNTKELRQVNNFMCNTLLESKDDDIKQYKKAINKAKEIIADIYIHKYALKIKAFNEINKILGV